MKGTTVFVWWEFPVPRYTNNNNNNNKKKKHWELEESLDERNNCVCLVGIPYLLQLKKVGNSGGGSNHDDAVAAVFGCFRVVLLLQ